MTKRYNVRKWLNRKADCGGGHIIAKVDKTAIPRSRNKLRTVYLCSDNSIEIADCSRKICLDFDWYDRASGRNRLRKLDILIQTLTEFRTALKAEYKTLERIEDMKKALPPEKDEE